EIVQPDQAAGVVAATREGDLELAPEVLRIGMAEQEIGGGFRVRGHVECLLAADAGDGAGGDVAHGVAASFARGDPNGSQAPHDGRGVLDVDEVELEILPCGPVRNSVR